MSTLTDLRAALDELDAAIAEREQPLPVDEVTFMRRQSRMISASKRLWDTVDADTIRALLDVAEAAWVFADNIDTYCPCCDSHLEIVTVPTESSAAKVYAALAPLVKEATDE